MLLKKVNTDLKFKLQKCKQCSHCPWLKTTNPYDIPHNYSLENHENLRDTIATASSIEQLLEHKSGKPFKIMACHESTQKQEYPCIGWLINQNNNNNIRLRIWLANCENYQDIELAGEQHDNFEGTIPQD